MDDDANAYLPTPEEIAAECAKIRAGWSAEERERRRCPTVPVRSPSWRTISDRRRRGYSLPVGMD